jgi:hypothetical protein
MYGKTGGTEVLIVAQKPRPRAQKNSHIRALFAT